MNGDGVSQPVGDRDEGLPAAVGRLLEHVHALVSLLFRAGLALDSSAGPAKSAAGRATDVDGLAAVDAALPAVRRRGAQRRVAGRLRDPDAGARALGRALNLFHRDTHALDPGTVRVA